jgi:hypothetical protein
MRINLGIRTLFLVAMTTCSKSGSEGTSDASCPVVYYTQPGCGVESQPRCYDNHGGSCGSVYCDCSGKVQSSWCTGLDRRYAYRLPPTSDASTCDPNADAGAH